MLPKQNRLIKKADFERVYKFGRFAKGGLLNVKCLEVGGAVAAPGKENQSQFGFVVSKKVSKSAVKRNRIKRILRELVHLMLKKEVVKPNYLVVVLATAGKDPKEFNLNEITKELSKIFKKLEIIE